MGFCGQKNYVYVGLCVPSVELHKASLFCVSMAINGHIFLYSCSSFLSTEEARSNPGEASLNKKIVTGEQELLVRREKRREEMREKKREEKRIG